MPNSVWSAAEHSIETSTLSALSAPLRISVNIMISIFAEGIAILAVHENPATTTYLLQLNLNIINPIMTKKVAYEGEQSIQIRFTMKKDLFN